MAVRFDAASDRISFAGTVPDPASGITVLGWAYVSVDTNANATFIRLHASSGGTTSANVATGADGLTGPGYFTAGGSLTSSTNMVVGEWRRWAITCLGTAGALHVATPLGAIETDTGTVAGVASPTGITLGGRSPGDSSETLNGRLAYVRIWTKRLDQGGTAPLTSEWSSTTPVDTSQLWADWPLETASDLTDHSGNGRHLTAGTTAVTTEDGPPITTVVSGVATANLGSLVATAVGTTTQFGSAALPLGQLFMSLVQRSTQTIRVSGREPSTHVSGREPRMSI